MSNNGAILITDSLFIGDEHVQQIERNGYSVQRLDEPEATEAQLIEAISGKVGYILGGTETVTKPVLEAADKLKVISFTGAGYAEFIPAYEFARDKGIAITAAKGGNSQAVAEFALTLILMATRKLTQLTDPDGLKFETVKGVAETTVGIIGMGDIGKRVAHFCESLGYSVLIAEREGLTGTPKNSRVVPLNSLLSQSDIISIHVSKIGGTNLIGKNEISLLKEGASIINTSFLHAIDKNALIDRLKTGEISAYLDSNIGQHSDIKTSNLIQTNIQSGFNTFEALKAVSDQTTRSLLSVLQNGEDDFRVI